MRRQSFVLSMRESSGYELTRGTGLEVDNLFPLFSLLFQHGMGSRVPLGWRGTMKR